MELFYNEERDTNLFEICEKIRKDSKEYLSVKDITSMAVVSPCDSFFLCTRYIAIIITMQRCEKDIPKGIKGELYREIFKRYWEIKKQNPTFCVKKIARIIEEQPAPRFYMSRHNAMRIYYRLIKTNNKKNAVSNRNTFYNRVFGV